MLDRNDLAAAICHVRQEALDDEGKHLNGLIFAAAAAVHSNPDGREQLEQATLDLLDRVAGERDGGDPDFGGASDLELSELAEVCDEALELSEATLVHCSLCQRPTPAAGRFGAHRHQDAYIGEECWDERLRGSE